MAMSLEKIRLEILSNPELAREARKVAEKIVEESKRELVEEFDNHPVTKEIEAGPNASNSSGTLGGRGNLFSFIGFNDGSDPVSPVRELLRRIKLSSATPRITNGVVQFKIDIPDRVEFESISKMPWESGRSWLYDIERAISGLSQYLYGQFKNSRSGTGVEIDKNVTSNTFTPVRYFNNMLDKFSQKLRGR